MENEFDILIGVLAETNDDNIIYYNVDSIVIQSLHENYNLVLDPLIFNLISESVSDFKNPKKGCWHEIKLKHIIKNGGWGQPNEEYFEPVEIREIPFACSVCEKEISEDDFINSSVCCKYCADVLNGVPMPYSQSAHIFDIFHNDR